MKLWSILFLSFSSGLPFLLILSTLSIWLAEVGISKTQIGLLAWVTVPYSLKFLLAPLVDQIKIPFLTYHLGQRRSWALLSQIILTIALLGIATTDPKINITSTAYWALLIGLGSAIQDIVIEAYRIEILPTKKIGSGASISVLGYRLGMLCSGAGAIFISEHYASWQITYLIMSCLMTLGIITTLMSSEPNRLHKHDNYNLSASIRTLINNKQPFIIILLFIISYKFADTVLNVMSMPFLLEIGFSKLEIAYVAKSFGIINMIIGGSIGGLLISRYSLKNNLFICAMLQMLASSLFVIQASVGHNVSLLFWTMGVENFTCGMSQVTLIAYLSRLCSRSHIAMHYAILSSFASLVRIHFSTCAGWMADLFAWSDFYILVTLSCIPSLIILIIYSKHFNKLTIQNVAFKI